MKVVIIEDEELAAARLERMILGYDKSIEIVAKLESIEESVDWFKSHLAPDLIFLDIHLEDGLSFAIFDAVEVKAPIIFTTAFDEYAIKAFKMKSIDYLLKPIVQEELNAAIKKYQEWTNGTKVNIDLNSLYELISKTGSAPKEPEYKNRFAVQVGQKIKTVGIDEIAYFYSEEGVTFLVSTGKSTYTLDSSLEQLGEQLNPKDFFRINRAFLVRLPSIANVHVFPKSRLKLDLNPPVSKEVYVSIDKVTKFKEWLDS
jgi:DNA-binding LytR/AlgR family response regulator